jgi:hypothetical protein
MARLTGLQAATPGAVLEGCGPAGGVNLPALALPQHRLYLFPEPQGHGAQRAIGAEPAGSSFFCFAFDCMASVIRMAR